MRYRLRMIWVWRYLNKDVFFVTNTAYPYQELTKIIGKSIEKHSVCLLFTPGQAPAQLEEDLNQHVIEHILHFDLLGMDISRKYYLKILKEGEVFPK